MMEKQFLIEHRMKLAGDFESSGKYLHALQIYKSIRSENPGYSEAVIKEADLYRKTGNVNAADDLLKNYLSEDPDNKDVRFYFGEFLLNNSRWEEAIDVLSFFDPAEEPLVAFFTGYANFMLREYELARINFSTYTSLPTRGDLLYEAYFFLAKIEIELKKYESALNYLKKAEPSLSNFWEHCYLSALTYYNMGMYAHAVSLAEKSISLNSRETVHYNLAGKIYLKLGDYVKAEKYLRTYVEKKDNVASDTYAYLAEACLHNRKAGEAIEFFNKALLVDPYNKTAIDGKKSASDYLKKHRVSDG